MYIRNNNCDTCNNKNICKWCEEMELVQSEVKDVSVSSLMSPIRVNVTCNSFQDKPSGFMPGQRN